jgi:hypothetical protein
MNLFLDKNMTQPIICHLNEIIIQGKTHAGQEFRPRDWAERLSGTLSTFGRDQKLKYAAYLRPMMVNNIRCVALDKALATVNHDIYQYIMRFARDNDLQVTECQALIETLSQSDDTASF